MTDVKAGDRVRVVLEGNVGHIGMHFFNLTANDGANGNCIYPDSQHVVSVEVLKQPLKVGDWVEGERAYVELPVGTVLEGLDGTPPLVRSLDGMHVPGEGKTKPIKWFYDRRKVLFIP